MSANTGQLIQSINPATLEVNARIQGTAAGDVASIMDIARETQERWAALGVKKRLAHLMRARDYMLENVDDVARTITLDNGKTLLESLNAEIFPVLDMFRFCAQDAVRALREERISNPLFPIARITSGNVFDPMGVVGIISPWNYPFAIPMTQILPALLVGNTAVIKPSNLTALVGEKIREIFVESGMPEGVVNVIQGSGAALGNALMDARPDRVVFTGSVAVGKQLMARAAETLTPITLELGGKDPFIVLEDADVDRAAAAAVWGAFINAGQTCASVERVYVMRGVADKFIKKVAERSQKIRVKNGLEPDADMGPLISEDRITLVEAHLNDARERGARILCGGSRIKDLPGYFFEPTVIVDVDHTMDCMREETFGPTLPIMVVDSEDQAVALANDSEFGLTASVWSADAMRARRVARRIRTGTVVINNCLITYGFAQCPWGGVKNSGIGRTHSVHGLLEFTNIKNITTHKSMLREDLWWYPYSDAKYNGMKAALRAMFCNGMACKTSGVLDVLRSFRLIR